MLWSVVDLQLRSDAPGLGRGERLIECGGSMGVEVVHHQHYSLGLWVVDLYKLLYAVRPIDLRSSLGDAAVAPAGQRFGNDEEVGRPLTLILVVLTGCSSWVGGKWLSNLRYKLLALLIEAYLRKTFIVGTCIDFQNILHAPDEGGVLLWRDGPLPLEPGLYGTFFRVRLTSSRTVRPKALRSICFCLWAARSRRVRSNAPPALHRAFWAWCFSPCDGPEQPPSPPGRTSLARGKPSSGSPPVRRRSWCQARLGCVQPRQPSGGCEHG